MNAQPLVAKTYLSQSKLDWTDEAIDELLELSPEGNSFEGRHGPIGDWDVSAVTDMSYTLNGATSFNRDISKWDVSRATSISFMFKGATAFNSDIPSGDIAIKQNRNKEHAAHIGDA